MVKPAIQKIGISPGPDDIDGCDSHPRGPLLAAMTSPPRGGTTTMGANTPSPKSKDAASPNPNKNPTKTGKSSKKDKNAAPPSAAKRPAAATPSPVKRRKPDSPLFEATAPSFDDWDH